MCIHWRDFDLFAVVSRRRILTGLPRVGSIAAGMDRRGRVEAVREAGGAVFSLESAALAVAARGAARRPRTLRGARGAVKTVHLPHRPRKCVRSTRLEQSFRSMHASMGCAWVHFLRIWG